MSQSALADVSTAARSIRSGELPRIVPALTIVSHPTLRRAGERTLLEPLLRGCALELTRNAPEFTRPGRLTGLPLGDPFVSRRSIRFARTSEGGVRVEVEPGGTQVIAGSPIHGHAEFSLDELAQGVPLELADRVVLLLHLVDREVDRASDPLGMVGAGAGIERVRLAIERIVDLTVPVLIRGETGTGKELVASAIHHRSPRRGGPFISVNLGAIPRELAAAELFGAVRGSYTGATRDRDGLFRAAHGGTLFLDEVGEAPSEVQVMLLRALETGEIYPVGAEQPVAVQVRLIAATDANLEEQIRQGKFRAPLLHRLASYEVRLPALRERREDIGPLFHHFAHAELEAIGETDWLSPADPYAAPWLPASLAAQLVRHAWPGNIRQLRNWTRRLVIGSRGLPQLQLDPELAEELGTTAAPVAAVTPGAPARRRPATEPGGAPRRKPSEVSPAELHDALQASAWDLSAAADRLRIPRPSIYDLIERSPDIRTAGELGADEIARSFQDCAGDVDAMVGQLRVSRRALVRRLKELGLAGRPRSATRPSGSEPDGQR